jgi:hypothetical protein
MTNPGLAAQFWQEWLDDPDQSEESLRKYTLSLTNAALQAAHQENYGGLRELVAIYWFAEPLFTAEPLISAYESGSFYIQLTLADLAFLRGELEECWHSVQLVLRCMAAGDQRRRALAEDERPMSELRTNALGLLAACYVENQGLATPEEMAATAEAYWELAGDYWAKLSAPSVRDERRRLMQHHIAVWELYVSKGCLWLDEELARRARAEFNARHDTHLLPELRHFEELKPADLPSAWYWDYELAKLRRYAPVDLESMRICARNRRESARPYFGATPLQLLLRHWKRQEQKLGL